MIIRKFTIQKGTICVDRIKRRLRLYSNDDCFFVDARNNTDYYLMNSDELVAKLRERGYIVTKERIAPKLLHSLPSGRYEMGKAGRFLKFTRLDPAA